MSADYAGCAPRSMFKKAVIAERSSYSCSLAAHYESRRQSLATSFGDRSRRLTAASRNRPRQPDLRTNDLGTIWLRKTGRINEIGGSSRGWPHVQTVARRLCSSACSVFDQTYASYPNVGQRTLNRFTRLHP